jgi:ribosome-binding protein aMBF1 (putative translation factor)
MPKTENAGPKREPALVAVLRSAIQAEYDRGTSARELARRSGVNLAAILRFGKGERDITTTTAGQLAESLGLVLVPAEGRKPSKKAVGKKPKKSGASD